MKFLITPFLIVYSAFQIVNRNNLSVKLLNQDGAPIPDGKLSHIMLQYQNCSHFAIQVVFPDGFASTFMKAVNTFSSDEILCEYFMF